MKKLLFLTPELPYPAHSGGKLKSLKLLERFRQDYQVSLACPLKADDGLYVAKFLSEFTGLDKIFMHATDVPRTAVNLARSYLKGVPLNVLRTRNAQLQAELAAVIDDYDVVFIDHYEVAQYLPDSYRGQRIYHAHNAYHKLWERYAERGFNLPYRMAAALESRRVKRAEVDLCDSVDLVFAAPNDIDALAAAGANRQCMHETWHMGDDSHLQLPAMQFADTGERLLYVGYLGWEPNVAGLQWFIEEVWPRLISLRPGLQFDIVGRNPDPRLRRLVDQHPHIHLLGFVENLEQVYPRSRISVAPLLFGAGMKVKVLDAMARGIPVVTTPVGAEGIAAEHGQHLLICADAEQMAASILQLLTDPLQWQRLSRRSRELVAARYTWDSLFAMMLGVMDPQAMQLRVRQRLTAGIGNLRDRVYGAA